MMDLLELSGPERKSYADQVIRGLSSLGARLYILRRRAVDESYAKYVMQNTEHAVKETGVAIFRNPLSTITNSQRAYFTDEDRIELLHLLISQYESDKARDRDILSLEIVISRRQGSKTSNLFNSGHLLLTHNRVLSVLSRKFMRENKGYGFESVAPAVHISTLFAALWLELGAAERIEISRKQLVVACAEAVRIRPEIISRMRDTLQKIVPEKASQFDAMMSQPRYMQLAMDATLGQENLLTQQTTVEAFDKLEKRLVAEAESKAKAQHRVQRKTHKAELETSTQKIAELEEKITRERLSARSLSKGSQLEGLN
jgi:hypothetical protein